MSKKTLELPNISFNEALQRISTFDKGKLPEKLKQSNKEKTAPSKDSAGNVTSNKQP